MKIVNKLINTSYVFLCRKLLQEYTEKIKLLTEAVLKVLSRSLNLKESCFLDQYGENAYMVARFNYYPPSPRPDLTLGVKPHADGSAMTFLIQDKQVEGLQVLKDDQWFSVPTVPDALLVNIGDQVEVHLFKLCLQNNLAEIKNADKDAHSQITHT